MEMLDFISSQIISTIGWTIIHSLWQGVLISLLLATILIFIDKKNTRIRSTISYLALIFLFTVSIRTYNDLDKNQSKSFQLSTADKSIESSNNIVNNSEASIIPFPSEKSKSLISKYTNLAKGFISANINLIVLFWFAGIFILSIRLLGGIFYTQRLKFCEVIPVDDYWNRQIANLSTKLEITKTVKLLQSKLVKFPITIGYFKPVILLPIGFMSGIPQNQLEIILAHELAHIKRADYILNIFQSIIEVLFFFNPAVWWISKTIRKEREFLCDDLALETCGNSITLAKALLFVENSDYTEAKIAMALIGNKHSLMGRIKRMTHSKKENRVFSATLTIIPMLLLVTFMACSQLDGEIVRKGNTSAQASEVASVSFANSSVEPAPYSFASSESSSEKHSEAVFASVNSSFARAAKAKSVSAANALDDDKRVKLNFTEKNIKWKASFEDDKLVELYKDGEKVAKSEFSKYEDFVYERYEEFKEDMAELDIEMDQLKIDLAQLKVELAGLKDIEIEFDREAFAREMKVMNRELKEGLAELKDIDFDKEAFAIDMKEMNRELKEGLAGLKDIDFDIDFDELNESMKNIKVDLSGLDVGMANLDIELKGLKEELKLLKYFLRDLKDELVADGYLEDDDEDFELVLSKTKMVLNDERLPDKIHQKYLKLYKEHYGEDLDDDFSISN